MALSLSVSRKSRGPRTTKLAVRQISLKPARAPRRRAPKKRSNPASSFVDAYSGTLTDPFEFAPVPLGYDSFLPTSMATLYARGTFIVNVDGSFALSYQPTGGPATINTENAIWYQNSGANEAATRVTVPWTNQVAVSSLMTESRVVSSGMRLFALFPETSAPGVLFAGSTADLTRAEMHTYSPLFYASLPGSVLGIGSEGASVTSRPYDNDSFAFYSFNTNGLTPNVIPLHTCGYIAGSSFPTGTRIWFEAVCHLEGIARTSSLSAATPITEVPSASQFFPSPTALWSGVKNLLSSPVVMDAALAALHVGTYGVAKGTNSYMRARGTTPGQFGRGYASSAFTNIVLKQQSEVTDIVESLQEDDSHQILRTSRPPDIVTEPLSVPRQRRFL